MEAWEEDTAQQVHAVTAALLDVPEPTLGIPRAGQIGGWPARWWRQVAMRAALEVPGLAYVESDRPPNLQRPRTST